PLKGGGSTASPSPAYFPLEGEVRGGVNAHSNVDWYNISALTQKFWLELANKYNLKNIYPDKRIIYTLPCLRDENGNIISVPHLGIGKDFIKVTLLTK
ncbi:MAG: hypothetical protein WCJ33_06180, partial [Pseudomonadota bacterium]